MSVRVLFVITAREGLGIDVLQASQLCMKTLLFMGLSVKNCRHPYTIEKFQMIADELRAFSSLPCERSMEGSRLGLTEQLYGCQEQGSVSATLSELLASGHSQKGLLKLQPSCLGCMPQNGRKGYLSQLNDLLLSGFSGSPYTYFFFNIKGLFIYFREQVREGAEVEKQS